MFGIKIVFNSVLFYAMFVRTDAVLSSTGFVNNFMNDWNCRLNLMAKVDGSDSIIESYYNISGDPCKIYCRVRKISLPVVQYFTLNAPEFSVCAPFKFCHYGECGPCLIKRAAINAFRILTNGINRNINRNNVSTNEDRAPEFEPRININESQIEKEGKPSQKSLVNQTEPLQNSEKLSHLNAKNQTLNVKPPLLNMMLMRKLEQDNFNWERVTTATRMMNSQNHNNLK